MGILIRAVDRPQTWKGPWGATGKWAFFSDTKALTARDTRQFCDVEIERCDLFRVDLSKVEVQPKETTAILIIIPPGNPTYHLFFQVYS